MLSEYVNSFIEFNKYFCLGKPDEILKKYAAFNTKTRQYECTICQKISARKADLIKHIESVHFANYFVYSCEFCEKTFPNRNTLFIHRSTFHKNQKYYAPVL